MGKENGEGVVNALRRQRTIKVTVDNIDGRVIAAALAVGAQRIQPFCSRRDLGIPHRNRTILHLSRQQGDSTMEKCIEEISFAISNLD